MSPFWRRHSHPCRWAWSKGRLHCWETQVLWRVKCSLGIEHKDEGASASCLTDDRAENRTIRMVVNWYLCFVDYRPSYKVYSNPRLLGVARGPAYWIWQGLYGDNWECRVPRVHLWDGVYIAVAWSTIGRQAAKSKGRSQGSKVDVEVFFCWIQQLPSWGVLSELRFLANSANSSGL